MCLFNILCLFYRATLTNSPRAWVGMGEVRLFLLPHLKIEGAGPGTACETIIPRFFIKTDLHCRCFPVHFAYNLQSSYSIEHLSMAVPEKIRIF